MQTVRPRPPRATRAETPCRVGRRGCGLTLVLAAALLVFDITDVDTFSRVKSWVKELRQMAGACIREHAPRARMSPRTYGPDSRLAAGKDIALVLAGNKVDMERSRQVPLDESEAYAASIGATLFGTSAKLNRGVEQAFLAIARSACAFALQCLHGMLIDVSPAFRQSFWSSRRACHSRRELR